MLEEPIKASLEWYIAQYPVDTDAYLEPSVLPWVDKVDEITAEEKRKAQGHTALPVSPYISDVSLELISVIVRNRHARTRWGDTQSRYTRKHVWQAVWVPLGQDHAHRVRL